MAKQSDHDGFQRRGPKSRKHPNNGSHPHKKSVNALKSKIRDLERVLGRADRLPTDVQIEKERALVGYKRDLEDAFVNKKKQKMISKYHKIRFFERQKAARRLKKLEKQFEPEKTTEAQLRQSSEAIKHAQINLNYTMYYPLTEKYVSLFRGPEGPGIADEGRKAGPEPLIGEEVAAASPMWDVVKKCTEDGTLEQLRDGKLSALYKYDSKTDVTTRVPAQTTKSGMQNSAKIPQEELDQSSEDGSDGGFFEI